MDNVTDEQMEYLTKDKDSNSAVPDDNNDTLAIWFATIPLVAIVVINIFANGTILIIFIKTKCVRQCKNIFILSMTVSDLCTGILMPFSIAETTGIVWDIGPYLCLLLRLVRLSFLLISLLSTLLLTIDRWWSVNFPFSYRFRQRRKIAIFLVIVSWVLSFVLHIPVLVSIDLVLTPNRTDDGVFHYTMPPSTNFIITVSMFAIEYVVPMIALICLNVGIYVKLVKRRNTKKIRRSISTNDTYLLCSRKLSTESNQSSNTSDEICDTNYISVRHEKRRESVTVLMPRRFSAPKLCKSSALNVPRGLQNNRRMSVDTAILMNGTKPRQYNSNARCSFPSRKQSDNLVKDFLLRQDKKAFLSLGLLTVVAFVCRTPYNIALIIHVFYHIPLWVMTPLYWIVMANSTVNPFLYGIGNSDFRKVLKSWLTCSNYRHISLQETMVSIQMSQNGDFEMAHENRHNRTKNDTF